MKSVLRMRHYCDFCKKSTGTKQSMVKHESSCTANPERVCRMCAYAGLAQQSMTDLIAANRKGFTALRELAEDCPACIFAADRQTDWGAGGWIADSNERYGWDFKSACKAFLKENEPERDYGVY